MAINEMNATEIYRNPTPIIIEINAQLPGVGVSARKEIAITENDLSVANKAIFTHNFNGYPSSFLMVDPIGDNWEIPWKNENLNTASADFSFLRPLIGSWVAILSL